MARRFTQTQTEHLGNGVTNRTIRSRRYLGPYNSKPMGGRGMGIIFMLFAVCALAWWPWMLHTDLSTKIAVAVIWYGFVVALVVQSILAHRR